MENQEITSNTITFNHEMFGQIRTVIINSEPFFVAKDVADILEYSDTQVMTRRLDEDEKGMQDLHTLGGRETGLERYYYGNNS